jgi:hypothetical protein
MTNPGPFERRIGERVQTEPIAVTLILTVDGTVRSMLRRRPTTVELPARIVDVTISGAAIETATKPGVPSGVDIGLRYAGSDSIVRIRRSELTDQVKTCRYGVEFVRIAPDLKVLLHTYLQQGRPGEADWLRS